MTRMERIEDAARLAMGDAQFMVAASPVRPARLSRPVTLLLLAAAAALAAILLT